MDSFDVFTIIAFTYGAIVLSIISYGIIKSIWPRKRKKVCISDYIKDDCTKAKEQAYKFQIAFLKLKIEMLEQKHIFQPCGKDQEKALKRKSPGSDLSNRDISFSGIFCLRDLSRHPSFISQIESAEKGARPLFQWRDDA